MPDSVSVRGHHGPEGGEWCPAWCVTRHGMHLGEEDWVHSGAPIEVARDVTARLHLSVDPGTGVRDGPYLLVGTTEYTPAEAEDLGAAIVALARTGAATTRP